MALDYEITAVRTEWSDDGSHEHVDLVGYESAHMPGEEIMIPVPRVLQKMAFSEKFHVMRNGERAEVKEGKCPICGHEPGLVAEGDSKDDRALLNLPRE